MTRYKLYNWLVVRILLFIGISLCVFLYWFFYPYTTITYPTPVFRVLNEDHKVKAGDVLIYESDSCRHREGIIRVHRTLVNHTLIDFPDTEFYQSEQECRKFVNRSVLIPSYAPSGIYHLEITSTMQVNPIRSVSSKVTTEKFVVIGGELHD